MFSFFKKKPKDTLAVPASVPPATVAIEPAQPATALPDIASTQSTPVTAAPASSINVETQSNSAGHVNAGQFNTAQVRALPSRFSAKPIPTSVSISTVTPAPAPGPGPAPILIPQQAFPEKTGADSLPLPVETGIIVREPVPEEKRQHWLSRLKTGLSKTSSNLTTLFVGARIDDALYEELESALLMADTGVEATRTLLENLRRKVKEEKLTDATQVKAALRAVFIKLLEPLQKPLVLGRHQPMVMMVAGVNGAGKTTTIGKLAKHLQAHDQSVLLAAGDTFRAAAREQLTIWGERNNVAVIAQTSGDPAAVAFDAVHSAQARGTDVVMIDTAGRLPTQLHLMEELKKIKRVVTKGMASAPHEILLIIDGNTGQNALAQVKAFDDALGLTGLVITKLDGTAKGGVLAAIAKSRPVPVYFIGVGEQIEDLQPFDAKEFVDALLA